MERKDQDWPKSGQAAIALLKTKNGIEDFISWFTERYSVDECDGKTIRLSFEAWVESKHQTLLALPLKGSREF